MIRLTAICQAALSSLALAALVALTPAGARADSSITAPCTVLLPEASEPSTTPCNAQGGLDLAAAVNVDTSLSGENTLVENSWDFTKLDTIPGFASTPYPYPVETPYPVLSNPEIAD
jgi:hypothetical protein